MTPEELAVIQAAYAMRGADRRGEDLGTPCDELMSALDALDATQVAEAAELLPPVSRRWHLIVAGDRVLSKSGAWLEVAATQEMIDGVHVTLASGGTTRTVVKAPDEKVTVRRGEDGRAADEWARRFPGSEVITS